MRLSPARLAAIALWSPCGRWPTRRLLPPAPALPQISQDVFVTATISEPEGAPPRTTAVLSRDDLQRIGICSIIEGLRLIPGLDPRARGPRDVQTDLSIAARPSVRVSCSWTGSA